MNNSKAFIFASLIALATTACNNSTNSETASNSAQKTDSVNIKEEPVSYSADSATLNGFVAYDASKEGKRPVVLVVHEWWGLTDYPRMRAK